MQIIVEGTAVELDLPRDNVKLQEVVDEVEEFLFSVGKIPTSLAVNGHSLTQDELLDREGEGLCGDETLEFGVMDIIDFVVENIQGAGEANKELLKTIELFAEGIHDARGDLPSERLIQELSHFFDFWIKLSRMLPEEFEGLKFGEEEHSIETCLEHTHSQLSDVVKAMETNDFVLAADLLQYEVTPLVESIDQAIPELTERVAKLTEKSKEMSV